MAVGETAYFAYSTNCVTLVSGGVGDSFQSDGDSFALDERLLKLGHDLAMEGQQGRAYAEDMGTYGDALSRLMGTDAPAPILIDRRRDAWHGREFL